jgi:sulfonate transport system permease protein
VLGFIGGTFAGFAIHYLKPTAKGNALFLTALRSVPLFALIPLFVYWFAGHEGGVWGYIAFATFIIVASGVYQAVFNVPRKYLVQSHLLGASEMDQFRTVIVNAIIPEMVGTIRNVLGLSWAFSLGAEYTATTSGLGYLVYQSYLYADMGKLIALASVYSFCALLVFAVWNKMATHLTRWAGSI